MESLKGILEGPEFQAELPQIQPKPPAGSKPGAEEAVWLEHRTFKPEAFGSADSAVPITVLPCKDDGERWVCLHGGRLHALVHLQEAESLHGSPIFQICRN